MNNFSYKSKGRSFYKVDESSLGKLDLQASAQDSMVEAALFDAGGGQDNGSFHAEVKLVADVAAESADHVCALGNVVAVLSNIVPDLDLLIIQLHHEIELASLIIPHLSPRGPLL